MRGRETDFESRHPQAVDLAAVIEVSDSSLAYDRTTKLAIYAAAGIPSYWIVNLAEKILEVYTRPLPEERRYAERRDHQPEETVSLEVTPGQRLVVPVAELLLSASEPSVTSQ